MLPGFETGDSGRWRPLENRGGPLGGQCVRDVERLASMAAIGPQLERAAAPDELADVR
jgi:hypothetical protein